MLEQLFVSFSYQGELNTGQHKSGFKSFILERSAPKSEEDLEELTQEIKDKVFELYSLNNHDCTILFFKEI